MLNNTVYFELYTKIKACKENYELRYEGEILSVSRVTFLFIKCVKPDPYSEYGSESTKLLNRYHMYKIWIQIHKIAENRFNLGPDPQHWRKFVNLFQNIQMASLRIFGKFCQLTNIYERYDSLIILINNVADPYKFT